MDFNNILENSILFSLKYDDRHIGEREFQTVKSAKDSVSVTKYTFGSFTLTNTLRFYEKFGVYEWRNELENNSDSDTELISELWDCDISLFAKPDPKLPGRAWLPEKNDVLKIYIPKGSNWVGDEFHCYPDELQGGNVFPNYLFDGDRKIYEPTGGRSSETLAPFIELGRGENGFIAAIGWTGQWKCEISRHGENVNLRTGISDAAFVLHPHEKIHTSSMTIMPYHSGRINAHNSWRAFIREVVSPVGKGMRPDTLPFCAGIWGGITTAEAMQRLEVINSNAMPFECVWMDAGWYGLDKMPSPDEFEGNWSAFTGDWRVNPYKHPGGLVDFAEAVHKSGRKFLLWFEPERVRCDTPIAGQHPEYFITIPQDPGNLLLNLGDENTWNYCFETLAESIERFGLDIYRQDFNFSPLLYWRSHDEENRRGITEIKYINGLYRLWDSLLERFPRLLIDDCASGGRRIDIEMLRRSVPLWRSDAQCPANYRVDSVQNHLLAFNMWIPYSGTSTGRIWNDLYRFRSSYSAGLTTNYSYSARDSFGDNQQQLDWIKKYSDEYLNVRPYLCRDFYPLTEPDPSDTVWCAARWDRPENRDGVILAFRRENSPYEKINVPLELSCGVYEFCDADTGEVIKISSDKLSESGFDITIKEKRSSKLYFYRMIN